MFEKRRDLVKFLTVTESGAILAAADRLGITQPALSRVIARLERQFGGRLFERMPTGVRLTPLGSVVADLARHILFEIETAEERVNATLAGRTGSLRVTAGPMWMQAILPDVIARFRDSCPGMELVLHTTPWAEGVRLLANGDSDIHCGGIDSDESLPQFLRRERFLDMTWGIVAHKDHPLHTETVSDDALAEYPWIDFDAPMRPPKGRGGPSLVNVLDQLHERTGRRGEVRRPLRLRRALPDGDGPLSLVAVAALPGEDAGPEPQAAAGRLRLAQLPRRDRLAALVGGPLSLRPVPRVRAGGGLQAASLTRNRARHPRRFRFPLHGNAA